MNFIRRSVKHAESGCSTATGCILGKRLLKLNLNYPKGDTDMDKVSLEDLELAEFWQQDNEDMEVAANFPFTPSFPATTGLDPENHTVVYGEIESGKELATHTEDADELLVILGGTAEVWLGEEQSTLTDGELVLIPAGEPHGIRNTGTETVQYLGVFPDADVTSEFESELQPVGSRIV